MSRNHDQETDATAGESLTGKEYDRELKKLHVELVKLQEWVKHKGLKVCIVFEGRDGAGKGGTIKAITERVSPRVFRVVALPAPSDRQKSQLYMQPYLQHFPAGSASARPFFKTTQFQHTCLRNQRLVHPPLGNQGQRAVLAVQNLSLRRDPQQMVSRCQHGLR